MSKIEELSIIAGAVILISAIGYLSYQYFKKDIDNLISHAQATISSSSTTSSSANINPANITSVYPSSSSTSSNVMPSSSSTTSIPTISSQGAGTGSLGSETNWYFPYAKGWQRAGYYKSSSQMQPEYINSLSDFEATYPNAPTNTAQASTENSVSSLLGLNGITSQAQALTSISTPLSLTTETPTSSYNLVSLSGAVPSSAGAGTQSNYYKPFSLATNGIPIFYAGAGYYKSAFQNSPVYISSLSEFEATYVGSSYNGNIYIYN